MNLVPPRDRDKEQKLPCHTAQLETRATVRQDLGKGGVLLGRKTKGFEAAMLHEDYTRIFMHCNAKSIM
jgi:hypothetical protein